MTRLISMVDAPRRDRRPGGAAIGLSAEILAFPRAEIRGMVVRTASIMLLQPSMDQAEHELMVVMDLLWDDLERCGVACDAIEMECEIGRASCRERVW